MAFKEMVTNREIDHVDYIRKDEKINIFLKPNSLNSNPVHKDVKNRTEGPQYYMEISDFHAYNDNLKDFKEKAIQSRLAKDSTLSANDISGEYDFPTNQDNTQSWGWELIIWVMPTVLIFVLLIWSMRSMRGNMGGPGGIFNIGKSRAQEFDEKSGQLVTFKDVAGLEGAKFEIEEVVDF